MVNDYYSKVCKQLRSFESSKEGVIQEKPSEDVVKENKWLILTGNNGVKTMILKEDVLRVVGSPEPEVKTKVVLKNGGELYTTESFEQIYLSLS